MYVTFIITLSFVALLLSSTLVSTRWYQLQFQFTDDDSCDPDTQMVLHYAKTHWSYHLRCPNSEGMSFPLRINPMNGVTEPVVLKSIPERVFRQCEHVMRFDRIARDEVNTDGSSNLEAQILNGFDSVLEGMELDVDHLFKKTAKKEVSLFAGIKVKLVQFSTNRRGFFGRRLVTAMDDTKHFYRTRDHALPYFGPMQLSNENQNI